MTIAITGASGHIAASLVPLLSAKGYRLRALVHESNPPYTIPGMEFVKGKLSDKASLEMLVSGCDVVIHTAARISINSNKDPRVYDTNVHGTGNLIDASLNAGVKRFIHISSIHAYLQTPSTTVLDESRPYCADQAACYDRSKRDAEKLVLARTSGRMETIVLNPTAVVGPGDHRPSLMGQAIMDLYNNKVPMLIQGGFDFCDVRDVSIAIMNAMEKGSNANGYLLSGKWYPLSGLHKMIMEIKGEKKSIPVLPAWTAYAGLPFLSLMSRLRKKEPLYTKESLDTLVQGNRFISSRKANADLGYQCRPLGETIRDTINWFRQNGMLT